MVLIGTHIDGNILNILEEVDACYKKGCTVVQLFVDGMANSDKIAVYRQFKQSLVSKCMKCVVHLSYTINCAQSWDDYSSWIRQCCAEIETADIVGAYAVVLHFGKMLSLSLAESYNNMYTSLIHIHRMTSRYQHIRILLETPAGQGTEICHKLEDLSHFYRKLSKHPNPLVNGRFGICIDSCHVFAAGYDLRDVKSIKLYLDQFNSMIGIEHVKLIHMNDAMKELGSNVDRHENI
jgi:deoxyribonuclease-4